MRRLTGADAARMVLDANGLHQVRIERVAGNLTDHYDPRTNVIRLSDSVYDNASTAAIGVAAHEAGHAIQYATHYLPIKLRAASYVEKPIDLEEIAAVLRQVTAELEQRARPDPNLVFYRGEEGELTAPNNGQVYAYEKATFTALGNLIRHKRKAEAMELPARLYRDIRRCEGTPPEVVRNLYCQIVFALLAAAVALGLLGRFLPRDKS